MKFKLIENFNLNEDVFFHKAYRDKNGNVVDDQGVPINPKTTPDLAKRFSPFWDKADDDIIDPSEYNPFTDGVYPDWNQEGTEETGKTGSKPGDKQNSDNSTDGDEEDDAQKETEVESETSENEKKREYSKNSTEDKRIFIDTSTGKRYKKVDNKYVEI